MAMPWRQLALLVRGVGFWKNQKISTFSKSSFIKASRAREKGQLSPDPQKYTIHRIREYLTPDPLGSRTPKKNTQGFKKPQWVAGDSWRQLFQGVKNPEGPGTMVYIVPMVLIYPWRPLARCIRGRWWPWPRAPWRLAVAHGALVQVAAVHGACAHESVESPGPGWVGSRAKGLRQR